MWLRAHKRQSIELVKGMDKPVFIAGIGPRTGTTLIQRIVNTHPEAWIWGEVGGFKLAEQCWAAAWESANSFRAIFSGRDRKLYQRLASGDHLINEWVGGLMPLYDVMRDAYRVFFSKMLRTDRIWGFKAVSCSHLWLMREIFPESRIIVTFRSPEKQYKSYRTGINAMEPEEQTVAILKQAYLWHNDNKADSDLLLNLDEYDPNEFVEKIFAFIGEDIPPTALLAAKTKVRGSIPPPLETIKPEILSLLDKEVMPHYNQIMEKR